TLTGWGATYLALKEAGLEGNIVLADANIKYLKPLTTDPRGCVDIQTCKGKLSDLETDGKACYVVPVTIYDGDNVVAEFEGQFVVKK
ncbi:MAG: YiiD C-terminal domain-containing protein, partial [Pseudoalteromonas sp.]